MQCLILSIKRNTFCIHGYETIASVTTLPDVSATVYSPTWSGCDTKASLACLVSFLLSFSMASSFAFLLADILGYF
ncbi:hypothetical protein Hanom_Chr10g00914501 [Helianthus anomalus]